MTNKLEDTCQYCNGIWKPPRAFHCFTCKKCVMFGYHNGLVTGCVGLKNTKFYTLFVFYLFLSYFMVGLLFIIDLIFWIASCFQSPEKQEKFFDRWSILLEIVSFLLTAFFWLVALIGLIETIEIIKNNTSLTERNNREYGRPGSLFQNLKKFFGTNIWAWLFPIAPKLHVNALELTYRHAGIIKDENGQEIYEEDDFKALKIYSKYWIN